MYNQRLVNNNLIFKYFYFIQKTNYGSYHFNYILCHVNRYSCRETDQMIMISKHFKIITDIPVEALKGITYFIFLFPSHKCSRTEQYMCEGLCR